jgi:hypothetical protein
VMVLINIFYLFCVVFMASVQGLNCHTVYAQLYMQYVQLTKVRSVLSSERYKGKVISF